jgi:hypothetical protein
MTLQRSLSALSAGVLLAAFCSGSSLGKASERCREPRFHGRTAREWARDITAHPVGKKKIITELGPVLVPYLVQPSGQTLLSSCRCCRGPRPTGRPGCAVKLRTSSRN